MPDKVEASGSENDRIYDKRSDIIYIPRRLLGKGGFARVYEIVHPPTGIPYADKGQQFSKFAVVSKLLKIIKVKEIVKSHTYPYP